MRFNRRKDSICGGLRYVTSPMLIVSNCGILTALALVREIKLNRGCLFIIVILALCKIITDNRLTQSILIDNMMLGLLNIPMVLYIYCLGVS